MPIGNELLENNKRQIAELAEKIIERDNKIKEEQERILVSKRIKKFTETSCKNKKRK